MSLCPREISVERYERQFTEIGASGAIFLGQGGQHELLQALAVRFPIVVWGAVLAEALYCAVGSDNFIGGQLVGEELKARERKSILLLGNPQTEQVRLRFDGFNASYGAGQHRRIETLPVGFSYEEAYRAVLKRIKDTPKRVDGIFAATDTLAMAAIRAVREIGLVVPDDVAVVGYNDVPQSQALDPPLTTIRENDRRAGSLLVEKLMQIRDGVRASSVRLDVTLVRRAT